MNINTKLNVGTKRLGYAAVAAAAATGLLVTGCSSSSGSGSSSNTPAASGSPSAGPSGSGAPAGSEVSVDGKPITAKLTTTCAKQGGLLALALADLDNSTYGNLAVSATVDGTNVTAVGIAGTKGGSGGLGYALGYGKGAPGGSAKLTRDGNTFHITGEGIGAPDMSNPTAGLKTAKYDITFACDTIVGG